MSVQSLPEDVTRMVQGDFGFPLKDRLHIAPEIRMYKPGEDESIWRQQKEGTWEYQVFFDGEFICYLSINDSKQTAYWKTLKGILEAYKSGKIHFNQRFYHEDEEKYRAQQKANAPVNPVKDTESEEDKIVHEVFERVAKKKQKKSPLVLPNGIIIK